MMSKPKYFMGVDLVERPTYCLMKEQNGIITVVSDGTTHRKDEKDFKLKVEKLAEQYNAVIFQNGKFNT